MNNFSENPFDWIADYQMTDEEVASIAEPEWIVPNLIISGHSVAIVAEPNGGKTAILLSLIPEMVLKGYQVFYINADAGAGDAKRLIEHSKEYNYELLLPDLKPDCTAEKILGLLITTAYAAESLSGTIIIFDTLKKFVDVINKHHASKVFKLLRTLTLKGATVIVLGHTNKYPDSNGNPIYEGTADLRADMDELIYLIPCKQEDGSMIVSSYPDKVRAEFNQRSFSLRGFVARSLNEFVDTKARKQEEERAHTDKPIIDAVRSCLESGEKQQQEIISNPVLECFGEKRVRGVLKRYACGGENTDLAQTFWITQRQSTNNALIYSLTP